MSGLTDSTTGMAADGRASVKLRASNSTVPAFDSVMQTVDLLLAPRWLIPIEPEGVVLEGHALVANGGRIVAVLPLSARSEARRVGKAWVSTCRSRWSSYH